MGKRQDLRRGTTLIELMVALSLLLIGVAGFWSAVVQSVMSTGIAHRRTVQTWLRSDLSDRISLTTRGALTPTPPGKWIIEQCFDNSGRATGTNHLYLAGFGCAPTDGYRRWVSLTQDIQQVNTYGFAAPIWRVAIYVENIANSCTPETRYDALGCSATDYYLTD